jgi:hypothetical protein
MSKNKNVNGDDTYTGYPNRSPDPPSFEQTSTKKAPVSGQRTNNDHGYQHMAPYMRHQAQMYHGLISHGMNGHAEGNYSYFPSPHHNMTGNHYHIITAQPQNHIQRLQTQQQKHHMYYQQLQSQALQNDSNRISGIETNYKSENGQIQQTSQLLYEQHEESNREDKNGYERNSLIENYTISIISLSTKPLSGSEILNIVKQRTKEVETSYLPCVDFLVMCQQELRHALTAVTQKNGRKMSTSKFYQQFFHSLPQRFYDRFHSVMNPKNMNDAYIGIQSLLADVKKAEYSGKHENMKNAFLGGMLDGESWGLRKWMSKHGGALHICNDLELIWTAFRSIKDPEPAVIEIARLSRPLAEVSFGKLTKKVPQAYQERSTAHPYLPFFHRLESVLQGLSEFDPEDDDVICLDDSGDQQMKSKVEQSKSTISYPQSCRESIRQSEETSSQSAQDTDFQANKIGQSPDSNSDSDIEIIDTKALKQRISESTFSKSDPLAENNSDIASHGFNEKANFEDIHELAGSIESIASSLEQGQEIRPSTIAVNDDFWSSIANYVGILRLFRNLIVHKSGAYFMDITSLTNGDKNEIVRYYDLIKRPIFFRDIITAMKSNGVLKFPTLNKWNVFRGEYFIQAVDLVFVNALAFVGREGDLRRKEIESVRQLFWKEIRDMSREKKHIPLQRKETSEFIVRKKK